MIELKNSRFTDILPQNLACQPETQAFAYAVSRQVAKLCACADKARIYAAVDTLPEPVLDILAVELRTPAYDDSFPVGVKRALIEGTLPFYAHAGTPAAVDRILAALFGEGHIEEWFEYGGEPHHFRAYAGGNSGTVSVGSLNGFRQILGSVKRLSSWLDEIITATEMETARISVAPYLGETYEITVLPEIVREFPPMRLRVGAVQPCNITETALPPLPGNTKEETL